MGLMSTRDHENIIKLFELMENFITPPDLIIYLRSSVGNLVEQIAKRGREYEESIRLDYLHRLNERYEAWISTYNRGKVLIIDVDNLDFENNPEDLGEIVSGVDRELHGLFQT
jgi:deoxyadenosine/deoxycytidine kinase